MIKVIKEKWRNAGGGASGPKRRVAVFDADGTLWRDDVGEAFFKFQIENKMLSTKNQPAKNPTDRTWQRYWDEKQHGNKEKAYALLAQWNKGTQEVQLQKTCDEFFKTVFMPNVFKNVKALVAELNLIGFEIWVVSASPRWPVVAGAKKLGIHPERVIAVTTKTKGGVITDELAYAVPFQKSKVDLIRKIIKEKPVLAVGNTFWDRFMLLEATQAAIAVHSEKNGDANYDSEQELKKFTEEKNRENTRKLWITQKGV